MFAFVRIHPRSRLGAWIAVTSLIGILVLFAHQHPRVVEQFQKLRDQSVFSSTKTNRRCPTEPEYPGVPVRSSLQSLWHQIQSSFDSHPPILDSSLQRSFNYHRFEPLLPSDADGATRIRTIHERFLEAMPSQPDGMFRGRGVVIVAGGARSEYAATSLNMIRYTGSRLPVELWFVDPSRAKKGWCESLVNEGVTCRFISDYIPDAALAAVLPYEDQYKTIALILSAFSEILFLSPETLPIDKVDGLFEAPLYKQTGCIVWPDFWSSSEMPWAAYATGQIPEAMEKQLKQGTLDSSQLLINKDTHWKAILLTAYYTHYSSFFHSFLSTTVPSTRGFGASINNALHATKSPNYRLPTGPEQVSRSGLDGEPVGSGVVVLHAHAATNSPLLMRTSIVRFGARDLLCDASCIETSPTEHTERFGRPSSRQRMIGKQVRTMGAFATRSDPLHQPLKNGQRILSWKQLERMGLLGVEKDIWRALERVACDGAWHEDGLCKNVQGYVGKAIEHFEPWRGECSKENERK